MGNNAVVIAIETCLLWCLCIMVTGSFGYGKVFINEASGIVVQEGMSGSLNVSIVLVNETTYESDVEVTCQLSPEEDGYSVANFTTQLLDVDQNTDGEIPVYTTISFTASLAGRETSVTCWGLSVGSSTQFTEEDSISDPLSLRVNIKGKVSICDDLVVVPNTATGTGGITRESFLVELSETVQDFNVTINCRQSPNTDSMQLEFYSVVVDIGEKRKEVDYSIFTVGNPADVQCSAQSAAGDQFILSESFSDFVQFVLDEGVVKLNPQGQVFSTDEFQMFLILDAPLESEELTFTCNTQVANTTDEALVIASDPYCEVPQTETGGNSTTTTTTTSSPVNETTIPSGVWFLTEGECSEQDDTTSFVFARDGLYKLMNVCRRSAVTRYTQEYVIISCCTAEMDELNPKYENTSTTALNVAHLTPMMPYDLSNLPDVTDTITETEIPNPAWVEVAPCPCDLTIESCDVNCCCDSDCSSSEKTMYDSCIEGPAGGNDDPLPETYCESTPFNPPDWFQFLCVQEANSAYLGRFFYPRDVITSDSSYEIIAGGYRDTENTYLESEDRDAEYNTGVYSDGDPIKTALPRTTETETYLTRDDFKLSLPTRMAAGGCIWASPIRYLRDSDSQCVEQLTAELCTNSPRLNARLYVESTTLLDSTCPDSIVVLADTEDPVDPVLTNTNYLCADNLKGYVQNVTTLDEIYTENTSYFFPYELSGNGTSCAFDENGIYTCDVVQNNASSVFEEQYVPARCFWDDGYNRAPEPMLDSTESTCLNAIVDVLYNFTWSGSQITSLEATIVLGNISLTLADSNGDMVETTLSQNFEVNFYHVAENATDAIPFDRSGNPGYEIEKPVISGNGVYDDNGTLLYVDTGIDNSLNLWAPSSDGLCFNSGESVITFGENAISSCILRLSLDDLSDCDFLRSYILSQQDRIMDATLVSMVGNSNSTTLDDYVQVLREDISNLFVSNETVNDTTTEATSSSTTTPSATTDDGTVTYPPYIDQVTGSCENIPSGIHVDILYAKAGEVNDVVINRIVGAKVSYTLMTWSLECSAAEGTPCYSDSSTVDGRHVQSFLVTSSAAFIEVPATTPTPKTRYEEEHSSDLSVCRYESCWGELFYPLLSSYTGEAGGYGLAVAMTSIFFLVGLFMISRPWW